MSPNTGPHVGKPRTACLARPGATSTSSKVTPANPAAPRLGGLCESRCSCSFPGKAAMGLWGCMEPPPHPCQHSPAPADLTNNVVVLNSQHGYPGSVRTKSTSYTQSTSHLMRLRCRWEVGGGAGCCPRNPPRDCKLLSASSHSADCLPPSPAKSSHLGSQLSLPDFPHPDSPNLPSPGSS